MLLIVGINGRYLIWILRGLLGSSNALLQQNELLKCMKSGSCGHSGKRDTMKLIRALTGNVEGESEGYLPVQDGSVETRILQDSCTGRRNSGNQIRTHHCSKEPQKFERFAVNVLQLNIDTGTSTSQKGTLRYVNFPRTSQQVVSHRNFWISS